MFDVYCYQHGCRVLLGPGNIEALINSPEGGVVLEWRCYCGATGTERFRASTTDKRKPAATPNMRTTTLGHPIRGASEDAEKSGRIGGEAISVRGVPSRASFSNRG
jgi:hypothetical protein